MSKGKVGRLLGAALGAIAILGTAAAADAQDKKIKIGVIYDLTGPFAGAGSELQYTGAKIMMDYFIKKGGVEGYQIEPVYADSQSKPDVAINEAVRLVEKEKVDVLLGSTHPPSAFRWRHGSTRRRRSCGSPPVSLPPCWRIGT